jgi:hypothetical protein
MSKKLLRRFLARLAASITRRRDEARLREEIEEHLSLQTAENITAGMSPGEARRQAVLKFGAIQAVKETVAISTGSYFSNNCSKIAESHCEYCERVRDSPLLRC